MPKSTRRKPAQRKPVDENPNTPVAVETPDAPGAVPFAERDEVTVNPNTPVAVETPDAPGAIPFAGGDEAEGEDE